MSLSDKECTIVNLNNEDKSVYPKKDVKEFIKKVKNFAPHDSKDIKRLEEYIDKLAGEKLAPFQMVDEEPGEKLSK